MKIHVDLVPSPLPRDVATTTVTIVVDVLRTATVAALLFELGAATVTLVSSVRAARQLGATHGSMLVGERDGVPPEGFNHGSAPSALRNVRLAERDVVLLAAESPAVLAAAAGPALLAGFTNAVAVAEHVMRNPPPVVHLVCAGDAGEPDLADTIATGLLVNLLDRSARLGHGIEVSLSGAARFCLSVLRTTKDPLDGIWAAEYGSVLRAVGLEEDLAIASEVAANDVVPLVSGVQDVIGHPAVRLAPAGS